MLRGHATARVDAKGRIKIPAEFLDTFLSLCGEGRRVYITSLDGVRAQVYPLPVFRDLETRLAKLNSTDPLLDHYKLTLSYWGRETSVDRQGRILIHPLLRERARFNGEVSVFGKQRVLELCDHARFREQPPVLTPEQLAQLAQYGL
ncbi:MAG: division/cell wall cluster transcriptional repressor MraZ [Acidobacteria bacterium]|nr:MAG: division/cell wall cluster transcriptional repressor MraZ [Acidobacteriota bacterium]